MTKIDQSCFQIKRYTLVFPYNSKNTHVLLGLKKRGFGVGKWNGFGGKVEENESINACAARELKVPAFSRSENASEEMMPRWFSVDPLAQNHIPYDQMWEESRIWYHEFQKGQKFILNILFKGNIDTSKDDSSIISSHLKYVDDIYNYTYADFLSQIYSHDNQFSPSTHSFN
ncbi:hypothetical protein PORY_000969 [Pneumocystis oryctolagi]|uniref:Uncharacterized protein n=1 Tax=Pneumocystis oryctolagi TaxID=42067 RepID=A0ACB7CCW7_9ASCO|nr:hypothetical protein PORY_000969 [Pneumocystis oryctolagi]